MPKFREITMGDLLRETAGRFPDREALVHPEFGVRQTYGEFLASCTAVAKGFMALGVQSGDKVSVWTTNLPEWVYLQFGLGMIGAVLVTVNTNYKSHELEYILQQSDSMTLVIMEQYRDSNFREITRSVLPGIDEAKSGRALSGSLPFLRNVVYIGDYPDIPGMKRFDDVVALAEGIGDDELAEREKSLDCRDVVNMQYTSGTTGFPKGVMLTHYNIVNNARMVGEVMGMSERDRLLIQVPFFHCFGCVMSTLNCVYYGATMVVLEYFDPLKALQTAEQERCTAVNGVPTMFIGIMSLPEFRKFDLSSLRTGIMAGSPCPTEAMKRVISDMHCPEIVIAYGLTESSPVMTMTRRDDPLDARVSTVGRLFDGVEARIIDPETGDEVPPGIHGEIITRSPCVMEGYYKMPDETAVAIDGDGWLHTGDLGTVDEDGYFRVTGRIKDMIIRGGENIYPREIEEFLHAHTKVQDIYVVGVPDAKYGEQILAIVVPENGVSVDEKELVEFCRGRISRHKIPKYWRFTTDIPMTASGKVQKYKLVERYSDDAE
ncbi:MAG: AMP-binding protein [delta proteobacterium MLS_D]|jgi:fatty-acyl-CoA synthase|nr:MAG: AMP-binding protein [delta proteobacterium MLS_D]